jgi:hypothetical protein
MLPCSECVTIVADLHDEAPGVDKEELLASRWIRFGVVARAADELPLPEFHHPRVGARVQEVRGAATVVPPGGRDGARRLADQLGNRADCCKGREVEPERAGELVEGSDACVGLADVAGATGCCSDWPWLRAT